MLVDTWQPNPEAAVGFYTELLGCEAENAMPSDSPGKYFMCKLRGREIAGVGSQPTKATQPVPE